MKNDKKNIKNKQLFGTSSNSDFILNMKPESVQKMVGIFCAIAMLVLTLFEILYYFTRNVFDKYNTTYGMHHYFNERFLTYLGIAVLGIGLLSFIIYLIVCMKKQVVLKDNKTLIIVLAIMILSAVSCITASDKFSAVFGYLDRSEGLLTLLGYWGYFALGMSVTADDRRFKLSDFLVGLGVFNALAGLLQAIPFTAKFVPNYFQNIFEKFSGSGTTYLKQYVPTGFLVTPFAFAAVMTVLYALALNGTMFDKSKSRKIFYGISALLMGTMCCLTSVVAGIIGISVVTVFSLVCALIKLSDGKTPLIVCVCAAVVIGGTAGTLYGTKQFELLDESIIIEDAFDRLTTTTTISRDDTSNWIYAATWDDGMYTGEQNLLLGVGPDNSPSVISNGSVIDRSYNEYIDVFQYRGIFTFALTILFVIITLKRMLDIMKKFAKNEATWFGCAVCAAALGYFIQAFFNITSNYSSPFTFMILGFVWSFGAVKKSGKSKELADTKVK